MPVAVEPQILVIEWTASANGCLSSYTVQDERAAASRAARITDQKIPLCRQGSLRPTTDTALCADPTTGCETFRDWLDAQEASAPSAGGVF